MGKNDEYINVINAYTVYEGRWFFDEPKYGIVKKRIFGGVGDFLDFVTRKKRDKVKLIFSSKIFPKSNYSLELWEEWDGRGIYHERTTKSQMYLCDETKNYFNGEWPKEIHVQCVIEPKLTDEELSDIYAFDHKNVIDDLDDWEDIVKRNKP